MANWERQLREMVLAGGALAVACGGSVMASGDDASSDQKQSDASTNSSSSGSSSGSLAGSSSGSSSGGESSSGGRHASSPSSSPSASPSSSPSSTGSSSGGSSSSGTSSAGSSGGTSSSSGSSSGGSSSGGIISFRNDLLTPAFPAVSFEVTCGLSSSCHHDPVRNPKTDRVFLGCNRMNASCTATGDIAATVYAGLVGNPEAGSLIMSQELPTMPYVKPGDPDNSYLVHKLEGTLMGLKCVPAAMDPIVANAPSEPVTPTPDCGTQMPLTATPDATFNAKVRAWVKQGAMDN